MSEHTYARELVDGVYNFPNQARYDDNGVLLQPAKEVEVALPGKQFKIICSGTEIKADFVDELTAGEVTTLDSTIAACKTSQGTIAATFKYLVPSKLVENVTDVTEDTGWQDLGGVTTTLGSFVADVSKAWGRIIGQAKVSGSGAEMRVIRASDGTMLMAAVYSAGDTSGEWANTQFWVNHNQPATTDCFILQGRLHGATSMAVRYFSMSLLEKLT